MCSAARQDEPPPPRTTQRHDQPDRRPARSRCRTPGLESQLDTPADHGETSYRGTGRLEGRRALVTGGDSGIVSFTEGLAQMVASKGIQVPPEQVEDFGGQTPLGRAGQPVEVAAAFVFLASAESSCITGERLDVHGGAPLPWW